MARTTPYASVLLFAVLSGCLHNEPVRDLALNEEMYLDTGYHAKHKQERTAFVKPLVDKRTPPADDAKYPRTFTQDQFWDRPIGQMLNDLVRREIEGAGIFAKLVDDEASADWVVEPVLLDFHGYVEERPVGRRTMGQTTLHLRVFGKPGADGKREVLRATKLDAPAESRNQFAIDNPYQLATVAFRKVMGMMLVDLDEGGRLVDAVPGEEKVDYDATKAWNHKAVETSASEGQGKVAPSDNKK